MAFSRPEATKTTTRSVPTVETVTPLADDDMAGLTAFINERLAAHEYVGFGQAAALLGFATLGENGRAVGFKNSDVGAITTIFDQAVSGSSAIIVNRRFAHDQKVAGQHRQFLTERGYTTFPSVSVKGVVLNQG